jgi:hypothetical protein
MTTTNDTPNNDSAALERALLKEQLADAIVLESAHLSAAQDVEAAAHRQLRYDVGKSSFVNQETGEAVRIREWLRSQRESKTHWFKATSDPSQPVVQSKRAGFDPNPQLPVSPGQPAKDTAPMGRVMQEMSEHEFVAYRKQNRHARMVSFSNIAGRRVCVVDCGSAATAQQVGGQSMGEYRKWRTAQGLGNPVGAR